MFSRHIAVLEPLERRALLSAAFDVTGLTALRNDPTYSSIDGSGVGIAVLDSGVYAQNPDLRANVAAFYNAVEDAVPSSISAASVAGAGDTEGHGTHVSGIAASSNPEIGVAYKASLVDVKVIADSGESELGGDPLLRGLQFVAEYADQYNIKVVNMSLGESDQNGGVNLNTVPDPDDISREIQYLESLGITVVAAAGNSYANDPVPGESYPAVVSTISVASTWADSGAGYDFNVVAWGADTDAYAAFENSAAADRFSATSQRSTLANQVAAPGVDIYSTWNDSSSDNAGADLLYNTLSGTSMAAPFVSGLVALMQDAAYTFGGRYFTNPTQIRQIIQQTSDLIVDTNVADNGRVPLVNGTPDTSQTFDLPETGDTFYRVNAQRAVQAVRQLFTGGAVSTADLDDTTTTATTAPDLAGTRDYTGRGTIGTDGLNQVGVNDVDLYKVTLASPGTLTLALSQPDGGTAFAGELRLFDATGDPIAAVAGSAGAYPTLTTDPNSPLPTGTYYVGVSSAGNAGYAITDGSGAAGGATTGDYALSISLSNPDPNGVAQGAAVVDLTDPNVTLNSGVTADVYQGDIGSDPPINGSSSRTPVPDGDVDMFKVVAPDSGVLTVQTDTSAYGRLGVDSYVEVFDASLNEIAANDDISRFDTDSYAQVQVSAGQTYYVAVTNYANRSFDVRNPYGRVTGSTPSDAYYDLYLSFSNGDANGTAYLATRAGVGAGVSDSIGADGGVALTGAGGGDKDVDFYVYTAPAGGLLDFAATATTSGFSPALELWSLSADASSISSLAATTGSGNHLVVPVTAGQTLYVSVTGRGNDSFNWYALGSGTGGQTGGYTLASSLRPSSDYATLSDGAIGAGAGTPQGLVVGNGVYSDLGMDGSLIVGAADVDFYRVAIAATGVYDIRTDTSREGSADTVLRLFDASGNELAVNDNASDRTTSSLIEVTLSAGQTYYIGVSGAGPGATGYNPLTGAGAAAGSTGSYGVLIAAAGTDTGSFGGSGGNSGGGGGGGGGGNGGGGTTSGAVTIGVAGPAAPVSEPLPGQSAAAVFTVTLSAAASSTVTVDYATADGSATAGADYVATSGTLTFAAGQTTGTVAVPILGDFVTEGDESFSLMLANAGGPASLAASSATATIADLPVTRLTFTAAHPASYTDAIGRRVTLKLTGAGAGTALFAAANGANANPALITLAGTTGKSAFSVTPARGSTTVGGITVAGSLGELVAPHANLAGDVSVSGALAAASFASAAGDHTFAIGSGAAPMAIAFGGAVSDLSITTPGVIKSLRAAGWLDTDGSADTITAAAIGSLTVPGDFAADLILTSAGADLSKASLGAVTAGAWTLAGSAKSIAAGSTARGWSAAVAGAVGVFSTRSILSGDLSARTLGTVKVGGNLENATLRATAPVAGRALALSALNVKGAIADADVRTTGDIGAITAAALTDARIFAGVADGVSDLPGSAAELVDDAVITSVTVKGGKGHPFAVTGADIAAGTLRSITLGALDSDNLGVPFGVAAEHFGKYTRIVDGRKRTTTGSAAATTSTDAGDAVVRVLT